MNTKLTGISGLAKKGVGDISIMEQKVLESVLIGEIAYLSNKEKDDEEEPIKSPVLPPSFMRWILVDSGVKKYLDPKGIRIQGAVIPGSLDLENISLVHPLHLLECKIEGKLILENASLITLVLDGTEVSGVYAPGLEVKAWVFMRKGFHSRGEVNLAGAKIGQSLVCNGSKFQCDSDTAILAERTKVSGSVFMKKPFCSDGIARFYDAQIGGSLECDGGRFLGRSGIALDTERIKTGGHVHLRNGFYAQGQVNLMDARIGGNLDCSGGRFLNRGSISLLTVRAKINGTVFLRDNFQNKGFRAIGEVQMMDIKIGGNLECDGARMMNSAGVALAGERARIAGSVFLRELFQSHGEVLMRNTEIGKDLICSKAKFICPKGVAFDGFGIQVKGNLIWLEMKKPPAGKVIWANASVNTLEDRSDSWPARGQLELNGFEYRYIFPNHYSLRLMRLKQILKRLPWINEKIFPTRADWLKLIDPEYFSTQPYEQLASVYKRLGMDTEAKDVGIDRHRALLKYGRLSLIDRLLYLAYGLTVDYGFNSAKVIFLFIIPLIILGGFIFRQAYDLNVMATTQSRLGVSSQLTIWEDPEYPAFNPWAYSLDVFLPIVDLHQEDYWIPYNRASCGKAFPFNWILMIADRCGEWFQYYMWFHIASGWLFSTIAVVSITGIIKRE